MQDEEIREYLRKNAKILELPNQGQYRKYPQEIENRAVKLPVVPGCTYGTWNSNQHHFQPFYHFEYILPKIAELVGFDFKLEDFIKVEQKSGQFDVSYLKPKVDFNFEVYGFSRNEHFENVNYMFLKTPGKGERWDCKTDYHRQYRYPHECSRIINYSLATGRVLVISGDSTLIPDVPVLACYFDEVWYFDNRNKYSYVGNLRNTKITDVLFQIGFAPETVYWNQNLK